jgi:phage tail sheath gpL-like
MPSTGFNLTGVDPSSPLPGIKRELRFAQGSSTGAGQSRSVVLVGNKTSAGSETTNTLSTAVLNSQDLEDRVGRRSELYWMYNKYVAVDPNATIYIMVVPENGSGTAASATFTFVTAASAVTTLELAWGGETIGITVNEGDTAIVQAAALTSKINEQAYFPFTAAIGGSGSEHIVTITASNVGPRGDNVINRVRTRYLKNVTTTCTKSAITSGTGADDFTLALTALAAAEIYYHVAACTATSGVTATDNGVGEYISFISTQALPANGKSQIVNFGLVSTQANATTVATSSAANNVYAVFWHAENNDWTTGMIAAHCTAAKRLKETLHPSANLTGYSNTEITPFQVPDPFDKSDRPTTVEMEADLNNGVTPIAFDATGAARIVRQVTSRSWLGSSATKDYRAREGHIPSAIHYTWAEVFNRYLVTRQDHVAANPTKGQPPLKGVTYPGAVESLINGVIDDLAGPAIGGIPVLDPSPDAVIRMKKSVQCVDMVAGISATADFEPVRHNNKGHFLLNQTGPGY